MIPYLKAVRAVSNSNFGYWPGMDAGGLMQRYIETGTCDGNLFYSIGEYVPNGGARQRLWSERGAKTTVVLRDRL